MYSKFEKQFEFSEWLKEKSYLKAEFIAVLEKKPQPHQVRQENFARLLKWSEEACRVVFALQQEKRIVYRGTRNDIAING